MSKSIHFRQTIDIVLGMMVIGAVVFTSALGACMWFAKQEAKRSADVVIRQNIEYAQDYIDSDLARVEDAAYTLVSGVFGDVYRDSLGNSFVAIDRNSFRRPEPEQIYQLMENFMKVNPSVSGLAVGFEPYVYPEYNAEFGFAPYVLREDDRLLRRQIGEVQDYREREWYKEPSLSQHQFWSKPFIESSGKRQVATFSFPLHGYADRPVGVFGIDISIEDFARRLHEASPYEGTEIRMLDDSLEYYASLPFHYVFEDHHTHRNYMLVCPESEVLGGVSRMQYYITIVGIVSMIVLIVCGLFLFNFILRRFSEND